jgi:hypothetical protein
MSLHIHVQYAQMCANISMNMYRSGNKCVCPPISMHAYVHALYAMHAYVQA